MRIKVEKEKIALLLQYGDASGVWKALERKEINRRSRYRKQAIEEIIVTRANYSYWYARYFLKGRFRLGEKEISKSFLVLSLYTSFIESKE